LQENLANHPSRLKGLKGDEGLARARRLLQALREEQKGMTRADHEAGVIGVAEDILFGGEAPAMSGESVVDGPKTGSGPTAGGEEPSAESMEEGARKKGRKGKGHRDDAEGKAGHSRQKRLME